MSSWTADTGEVSEDEIDISESFEYNCSSVMFLLEATPTMLNPSPHMYDDKVESTPAGTAVKGSEKAPISKSKIELVLRHALDMMKRKITGSGADRIGIYIFNHENIAKREKNANHLATILAMEVSTVKRIAELRFIVECLEADPYMMAKRYGVSTEQNTLSPALHDCVGVLRKCNKSSKRVFFITDNDNPLPDQHAHLEIMLNKTIREDFEDSNISLDPFFVSPEPNRPFDLDLLYGPLLFREGDDRDAPSIIVQHDLKATFDMMLKVMRSKETNKRAGYSISFEIAQGIVIGIQGYRIITPATKGGVVKVDLNTAAGEKVDHTTQFKSAQNDSLLEPKKDIRHYFQIGGDRTDRSMMMENWQAVDPADDLHLTTSIDTMAKDYNGDEIASNDSELATLEGRQRASAERAYNASLHRMPRHHGSGGTSSKSMRRPFAEESQSQSQNDRPSSSVLMKKAPGAAEKLAEGKVFFDAETSLKIKTLGFGVGLKLLGFYPRESFLAQIKTIAHSDFIYPDESTHYGSTRTFSALLISMLTKERVAVGVIIARKASTLRHVLIVPQREEVDEAGFQVVPPGFNLIRMPFMDDLRPHHLEPAATVAVVPQAGEIDDMKPPFESKEIDAMKDVIRKLTMKSPYDPAKFPNPALNYHWALLAAIAIDDPIPDWHDSTIPSLSINEKASDQILAFLAAMKIHEGSNVGATTSKFKRKIEADPDAPPPDLRDFKAKYAEIGDRITVKEIKGALKIMGLTQSGVKEEILARALAELVRLRKVKKQIKAEEREKRLKTEEDERARDSGDDVIVMPSLT